MGVWGGGLHAQILTEVKLTSRANGRLIKRLMKPLLAGRSHVNPIKKKASDFMNPI